MDKLRLVKIVGTHGLKGEVKTKLGLVVILVRKDLKRNFNCYEYQKWYWGWDWSLLEFTSNYLISFKR